MATMSTNETIIHNERIVNMRFVLLSKCKSVRFGYCYSGLAYVLKDDLAFSIIDCIVYISFDCSIEYYYGIEYVGTVRILQEDNGKCVVNLLDLKELKK